MVEEDIDDRPLDGSEFTEREQDLLKNASPDQIRAYGRLDHETMEEIIIGYLISDPDMGTPSIAAAEKIAEAGIEPSWFEDTGRADLFRDFMEFFKTSRRICSIDDAYLRCLNAGQNPNQASMYQKVALDCKTSAFLHRFLSIDLVIERMDMRHRSKTWKSIIERSQKDFSDPKIGPKKAIEGLREACIRDLVDAKAGAIKAFDFVSGAKEAIDWLKDLKHHPERHRGIACGIQAIDQKTIGFRNGQLTVFVGAHGGFKTTTMINVAYGLWENGANVLYASLEMEAQIVHTKLLCRATGLSYSRLYSGQMTEPEDVARLAELTQKMTDTRLPAEQQEQAKNEWQNLNARLTKKDNQSDIDVAEAFFKKSAERKNRLVVVNVGQSKKMKLSQLERWLHEQSTTFKPDVIILDYLDLIEPENPNPDRLDVGFGDICKMSRAMGKALGFSVITAAQMKRSAIDRIRKTGMDNPEKALFGTDDVSGSHMIGGDTDNMFFLWRKGGNEIMLFTAKCRYTGMDNTKGETLQVDHDTCTIGTSEQIETLANKINEKSYKDVCNSINAPKCTMMPEYDAGFEPDCGASNIDDVVDPAMPIPPADKDYVDL